MDTHFTVERNVQIVISYLKAYGIRRIIASPGTTNITFVASVQQDPYFVVYSAPDERSAAYMACGMAAEACEPVVLSCTGATASRNYIPGLTEAYYRRLPVLALTATVNTARVANNVPQVIDRSSIPNDIARISVHLPFISEAEDEYDVTVKTARAFIALTEPGQGPVHINIETRYSKDFSILELPAARIIRQVLKDGDYPVLPKGRIGIFIGEHKPFSEEETLAIDRFCNDNNAVALCDQTSNFRGESRVLSALICFQNAFSELKSFDLLVHIGGISGDYYTAGICNAAKEVWRVDERGGVIDTFRKLTRVFKMDEMAFFKQYAREDAQAEPSFCHSWRKAETELRELIPDSIPFSNIWISSRLAGKLPESSTLHLGILNSLRSWNFFETPESVTCFSNVGGFGIDGGLSTLIGASIANKEHVFFGVFGDLAFFYDMNVLGNRNVGNNLRILLVNNGRGTEFRMFNHPAAQFKEDADPLIAAAGHYGAQSRNLVKHYAEDLGYQYLSASDKGSFEESIQAFLSVESKKSIIFEVFVSHQDENDALMAMGALKSDPDAPQSISDKLKAVAKKAVGGRTIRAAKIMLGKE